MIVLPLGTRVGIGSCGAAAILAQHVCCLLERRGFVREYWLAGVSASSILVTALVAAPRHATQSPPLPLPAPCNATV